MKSLGIGVSDFGIGVWDSRAGQCEGHREGVQGYLTHTKQRPFRTLHKGQYLGPYGGPKEGGGFL